MNRAVTLAVMLALPGCSWIGRQADHMGSYMPVIGERCEHWQCLTGEGQAISDANREMREREESDITASSADTEPQADPNQPKPLVEQPFTATGAP